jgi:putative phage-type endonuclease
MITKEILESRRSGIGGSDVAAILGISRYKTAGEIWLEKTNPEEVVPVENEYIYWGNCLEKVIAEEYQKRNGCELEEPSETFKDKVHPFLIANPDRLIIGKSERGTGILECKTCSAYKVSEWGEEGSDQIPAEYLLQIAHYRYVLDADFVDLAVLIGGNRYQCYTYVKNEKLENKMRERLCNFWNEHVVKKIPPEPANRRDAESLFRTSNDEKMIEADGELENTLKKIADLKNTESEIEEQIKALQDNVCAAMKDASAVINKDGEKICTWKSICAKRFDTTLFKQKEPNIYSNFLKESSSRIFKLNPSYNFGG